MLQQQANTTNYPQGACRGGRPAPPAHDFPAEKKKRLGGRENLQNQEAGRAGGRAGKFPKFLTVTTTTTTTGRQAGWAGLGRPIFNTINTTN